MVEIKVFIFGQHRLFHYFQHAAALITDKSTGQSLSIEFDAKHAVTPPNFVELTAVTTDCWRTGVTILYSQQNFKKFVDEYTKKFQPSEYSFLRKNCANAVGFALEYFFPETTRENVFYNTYQLLCCLCCIGTLGLKCFPLPPCTITTPNDIYKKAQLLSVRYGSLKNIPISSDEIEAQLTNPALQSMT